MFRIGITQWCQSRLSPDYVLAKTARTDWIRVKARFGRDGKTRLGHPPSCPQFISRAIGPLFAAIMSVAKPPIQFLKADAANAQPHD
jgi:hypothetical protein